MTPEEWAAKVVQVNHYAAESHYRIEIGDDRIWHKFDTEKPAVAVADCFRATIADAIRSAIAEALNAGMPGTPLSEEEVQAIADRHAATTQRDWVHNGAGHIWADENNPHELDIYLAAVVMPDHPQFQEAHERQMANAAFIAAAHQDIPALLSDREHTRGLLRDLMQDDVGVAYRRGYADGMADFWNSPIVAASASVSSLAVDGSAGKTLGSSTAEGV